MSVHIATGIDAIEIERVEHAVGRWGDAFVQRVFTPGEQEYCRGRMPSLAGRFAAKEAVSKALGVGIGPIQWTEIEVLPDEHGKPKVRLSGAAASLTTRRRVRHLDISITHSRILAIAIVVAWTDEEC